MDWRMPYSARIPETTEAEDYLKEAMEVHRALGDDAGLVMDLALLIKNLKARREFDRARQFRTEMAALEKKTGSRLDIARGLTQQADLEISSHGGDLEGAGALLARALEMERKAGHTAGMAKVLAMRARLSQRFAERFRSSGSREAAAHSWDAEQEILESIRVVDGDASPWTFEHLMRAYYFLAMILKNENSRVAEAYDRLLDSTRFAHKAGAEYQLRKNYQQLIALARRLDRRNDEQRWRKRLSSVEKPPAAG